MKKGLSENRLEDLLEVFVLEDRMIFSLKRVSDITEELEDDLKEYGIELNRDFKSPCG